METVDLRASSDTEIRQAAVSNGLGIELPTEHNTPARQSYIRRTPVGSRTPTGSKTPVTVVAPQSEWPLASPPSSGRLTGTTLHTHSSSFDDFDSPSLSTKYHSKQSLLSQPSDISRLQKTATASVREQYNDFAPRHFCSSSRHFSKGMNSWVALAIILLSVFSTAFSSIFLGIALRGPHYGRMIGTGGSLSISNAAFLTSFFAKMIELSFVTVVVAFLGQCLARRAYKKELHYSGVTLAELNMRNWVTQPGTMVMQWQSVRHAGPTLLGIVAAIAAIMATLYTSAATALVQPQLKFLAPKRKTLQGPLRTSFANTEYVQSTCKTPITTQQDDEEDAGQTCMQIEHAGQAYHNYQHWLADWATVASAGNGTRDLDTRPKGWALLNDNTTITAPWIEEKDVHWIKQENWIVNNITMAMPHPGVVSAALDPANDIMQPNELNGLGIYSIRASVPSPFVNVLCLMGLNRSSLQPLVYNQWPNASRVDTATWPDQLSTPDPYLRGTPFDDIFRWGPQYGPYNWPPVFPKLPINYNTVVNDTTGCALYGRTAIYVLGKGGPTETDNYALCGLNVGQTPNCSTQYNASSNVATLEATCGDRKDDMRFSESEPLAVTGNASLSSEWPNIASMWIRSINMNSGAQNSNSSNVRLWSELIFTRTTLDTVNWNTEKSTLNLNLPSPAEALAVMAGCTLLQSAQDAPFVEFFNYSGRVSILDPPQTQLFNASVHQQQYASGGTGGFERGFHIVLFAVFLINVMVLVYWIWRREWFADFSEPTSLFALAINSPPSEKLADCSCGADASSGERFKHHWRLEGQGGHLYMSSPDTFDEAEDSPSASPFKRRRKVFGQTFEMISSPLTKAAERRGRHRL